MFAFKSIFKTSFKLSHEERNMADSLKQKVNRVYVTWSVRLWSYNSLNLSVGAAFQC